MSTSLKVLCSRPPPSMRMGPKSLLSTRSLANFASSRSEISMPMRESARQAVGQCRGASAPRAITITMDEAPHA